MALSTGLPAKGSTPLLVLFFFCVVIAFWKGWTLFRQARFKRERNCGKPLFLSSYDPIGIFYALELLHLTKTSSRNVSIKASHEKHGSTFVSRYLGRCRFHTSEPKNIQAVLATNFEEWGVQPMRLFAFKPLAGCGIMCVDGARWARSRAIMKPTFSRNNIADLRISAYSELVETMIRTMPSNEVVDLQPFFRSLALDSATEFLFGEAVGALKAKASAEAAEFMQAYAYAQATIGKRMHMPNYNIFTRDKKFWQACEIVRTFVKGYVDEAAAEYQGEKVRKQDGNEERCVLARELVMQTDDNEETLNQLLNVFLPAHEATGVALGNLFFNLARHPQIYARARQEVLHAHQQSPHWTFERLKSLAYLQAVIKESFRLTPSIGSTTRVALRDTTLPTGGLNPDQSDNRVDIPVFLQKGDTVMLSYCALHRRKDIFGPDADEFRPDRWNTLRPTHWSYMAFGGGPRICIAQQLALTEVAFAAVQFMLAFEAVENHDPVYDFVEEYRITTSSRNGVRVLLKPAGTIDPTSS